MLASLAFLATEAIKLFERQMKANCYLIAFVMQDIQTVQSFISK